mmetsp:Transcript_18757/g.66247  ORF Transcript_18757/g.66247 Transcript_18757/m.66247 type:complete len:316 (+) Transcript_18757:871-1818(+)
MRCTGSRSSTTSRMLSRSAPKTQRAFSGAKGRPSIAGDASTTRAGSARARRPRPPLVIRLSSCFGSFVRYWERSSACLFSEASALAVQLRPSTSTPGASCPARAAGIMCGDASKPARSASVWTAGLPATSSGRTWPDVRGPVSTGNCRSAGGSALRAASRCAVTLLLRARRSSACLSRVAARRSRLCSAAAARSASLAPLRGASSFSASGRTSSPTRPTRTAAATHTKSHLRAGAPPPRPAIAKGSPPPLRARARYAPTPGSPCRARTAWPPGVCGTPVPVAYAQEFVPSAAGRPDATRRRVPPSVAPATSIAPP